MEIYQKFNQKPSAISKKYAYYLSCLLGMKKQWQGKEIVNCHKNIFDCEFLT